ncbi:MAG: hypothetical protein C4278_01230, partial [Patescibacteria group bacterium]
MKYLPLFAFAIFLDLLEFIDWLIAIAGVETVVVTILGFIIALFLAFGGLLFSITLLLTGLRKEFLALRAIIIAIQQILELAPVVQALPIRTITVWILYLLESGVLEKFVQRFANISQKLMPLQRFTPLGKLRKVVSKIPIVGSQAQIINKKIGEFTKNKPQMIKKSDKKPEMGVSIVNPAQKSTKTPEESVPTITSPRRLTFVFIFLFILPSLFVWASTKTYFYGEKDGNNVIISFIVFDEKTKKVINFSDNTEYKWFVPFAQKSEKITFSPVIFVKPLSLNLSQDFNISVKVIDRKRNFSQTFSGTVKIPSPDVAIIRKKFDYFELPFLGNIDPNDILYPKP